MKILLLHSDFIEFEPKKKAIKNPEEWKKGKERVEECLVVFTSVEKTDESNMEQAVEDTVKEIEDVARQVNTGRIVVYPYVHLSTTPASPEYAKNALMLITESLKKKFDVSHAPFGWYKSFNIKCKGHPLAELSRSINATPGIARKEDQISGALKQEEKVISELFVLTPDGKLTAAEKFNFKGHEGLKKFWAYEHEKSRAVTKEPPHIRLMRSLELVDYEPGSDPGNMRYYPKGRLVKSLLEQWVTEKATRYGAMEVETPVMYDFEHPALKDYLNRFPARQYTLESFKKKFFLRFSACFGQFLMKKNMTISYKDLPLKMYELTRYSFRLEKAGELAGLRRLRAFTMPDMHTLCADMKSAQDEFRSQFRLSMECLRELGFEPKDYETAIRFTRAFWKSNKQFVIGLAKLLKKPVLIETWDFRYAYFDPKFEFNFVDALGKASALSTVQIDHENSERYGVLFTDRDNTRKHPKILHCSPSGAIERCLYALLEKAHMETASGKNPTLPLWLSPTQIRLCPVSDKFNTYCEKLADQLGKETIRVDIDDRVESINRKVRDSEKEWVPYTVVVGEREKKSGKLAVRVRETGKVKPMVMSSLIKEVRSRTSTMPFKILPLPRNLSRRPTFVG